MSGEVEETLDYIQAVARQGPELPGLVASTQGRRLDLEVPSRFSLYTILSLFGF